MNSMLTSSPAHAQHPNPDSIKLDLSSSARNYSLPYQRKSSVVSSATTASMEPSTDAFSKGHPPARAALKIGQLKTPSPESAAHCFPTSFTGPHNIDIACPAISPTSEQPMCNTMGNSVSGMTDVSDPAGMYNPATAPAQATALSSHSATLAGACPSRHSYNADANQFQHDVKQTTSMISQGLLPHRSQDTAYQRAHTTLSQCRESVCGSPEALACGSARDCASTPKGWFRHGDAPGQSSGNSDESWISSRPRQGAGLSQPDAGDASDGEGDIIEGVQAEQVSVPASLLPEAQTASSGGLPHVLNLDTAKLRASAAFDTLLSMSTASEGAPLQQGAMHLARSEEGQASCDASDATSMKSNPYLQRLRWPPSSAAVQKRAWLHDALESSLKNTSVSSSAMQPTEAAIAPSNVLQKSMVQSWSSLQTLRGERRLGGLAFGDSDGELLQENVTPAQAIPFEPLQENVMSARAYEFEPLQKCAVPAQTLPVAQKGGCSL
jgi:hypothetical protein